MYTCVDRASLSLFFCHQYCSFSKGTLLTSTLKFLLALKEGNALRPQDHHHRRRSHRPHNLPYPLSPRQHEHRLRFRPLADLPLARRHARHVSSGEDLTTSDKDGTLKMDYRGVDTGCPEIDRARLQRVLLESVPNNYDSLGTQGVHLTSRFTKTWTKRLDKPGLRPASSVFTLTY